jgi:hypothetical protein
MESDKDKLILAAYSVGHLIKDIPEQDLDIGTDCDEYYHNREGAEDKGKNINRAVVEDATAEFLKRGGKIRRE